MSRREVTEELTYKHRAAALGCYYNECWHNGKMVATVGYNGVVVFDKGYSHTEQVYGNQSVVRIYENDPIDPQVPLE